MGEQEGISPDASRGPNRSESRLSPLSLSPPPYSSLLTVDHRVSESLRESPEAVPRSFRVIEEFADLHQLPIFGANVIHLERRSTWNWPCLLRDTENRKSRLQ